MAAGVEPAVSAHRTEREQLPRGQLVDPGRRRDSHRPRRSVPTLIPTTCARSPGPDGHSGSCRQLLMELPGCLDVPERFVETTCDVVVAVYVESRPREAARAGLPFERTHGRSTPAASALVFVDGDVVDPRHRGIIRRWTEPQHADPLAILRIRRDRQDMPHGRESIREERIERSLRGDLRGLADGLPVALELGGIIVDRPREVCLELIREHGAKIRCPLRSLRAGERRHHDRSYVVELRAELPEDLSRYTLALSDETQ